MATFKLANGEIDLVSLEVKLRYYAVKCCRWLWYRCFMWVLIAKQWVLYMIMMYQIESDALCNVKTQFHITNWNKILYWLQVYTFKGLSSKIIKFRKWWCITTLDHSVSSIRQLFWLVVIKYLLHYSLELLSNRRYFHVI